MNRDITEAGSMGCGAHETHVFQAAHEASKFACPSASVISAADAHITDTQWKSHITRMPSGAFLGQSRSPGALALDEREQTSTSDCDDGQTVSARHFICSFALVRLKPGTEQFFFDAIPQLTAEPFPKDVTWKVVALTEGENRLEYLIMESVEKHPSLPQGASAEYWEQSPVVTESQAVDNNSGAGTGDTSGANSAPTQPPDFGGVYCVVPKAVRRLDSFLSSVFPHLAVPPTVQRFRGVSGTNPASCGAIPGDFPAVGLVRSISTELGYERVKAKPGEQKNLMEACRYLRESLSRDASCLVDVHVFQDLDTGSEGRDFSIFYFLNKNATLKDCQGSAPWRRWRQQLTSFVLGPTHISSSSLVGPWAKAVAVEQPLRDMEATEESLTARNPTSSTTSSREAELFETTTSSSTTAIGDTTGPHISDTTDPNIMSLVDGLSRISLTGPTLSFDGSLVASKGKLVASLDPRYEPFEEFFAERWAAFLAKREAVLALPGGDNSEKISGYARIWSAVRQLGMCRYDKGWKVTELVPGAKAVFLIGDFNQWNRSSHPMTRLPDTVFGPDFWFLEVPDTAQGQSLLQHRTKVKLHIHAEDGSTCERVSLFSRVVWRGSENQILDGIVWHPNQRYTFRHPRPSLPAVPKVYEVYVGLCAAAARGPAAAGTELGTFEDCRVAILPRMTRIGYNTLVLLGLCEHPVVSFGWHCTHLLAPCAKFGTPEELSRLVDDAHGMGIAVVASVVQSHCSPSLEDGVAGFAGLTRGSHSQWDAAVFNFESAEVCRLLLMQLAVLQSEFKVDGFRFEGVTSMLYANKGIGMSSPLMPLAESSSCNLGRFFADTAGDSIAYLMVANDFLKTGALDGPLLTIASDSSLMPTVALSLSLGGIGFDYRNAPHFAQEWFRQIRKSRDEEWSPEEVSTLEHKWREEKFITAAECWSTTLRARRPLRVAMFAWESLLTHAVGGVAPHVTELAAGLARLGHEVHVFVRATGSSTTHSVHYGVHYHECTFHLNRDLVSEIENMCNSFVWHMMESEAYSGRRFDICHAHDWLATKALCQAKQSGHITIQTVHSTEFGRCGNQHFGGDSNRISAIERMGCTISDRVICVSESLAAEVCSLTGIHRQKVKVIYNGINAQNFDGFEDAAPIKARYNIPPLGPMFLFVGRLVVQKGPDLLIEAIPMVRRFRNDAVFVIVGDGYMRSDLERRANHLGIGGSCRFLGTQSGATLKSLFKACDAVVVPSRNEPFGIVVLEAWSAYKPVVATTCGGPRDFVTPNENGFLVDPSAGSISWGCCEILKNFEHARWMGQRGRVRAAYNFSWDHIAKCTESLYYEQLNRHDAPYSDSPEGDCSLASRLMGPALESNFGVLDNHPGTARGLALLKLLRLLSMTLSSNGFLNFIGNEIAHPDFVDMPRMGNQFSYLHTHRRLDYAADLQRKHKHVEFFDACLNRLEAAVGWLKCDLQFITVKDDLDKVLAFERGNCLFAFNFHHDKSYSQYQLDHSLGTRMNLVLSTDERRFGGFHRVEGLEMFAALENHFCSHKHTNSVRVDLPSRSAVILLPEDTSHIVASGENVASFLRNDPIFSIQDVDDYVGKYIIAPAS